MICKTKVFEMENAGDLKKKYHKVRDAIVGIMNNPARVLEPTPMGICQVGGLVRERAEDSSDWDGGDEQSTFDMAAVGKGMSGVFFVAGDLAISPECAQHQKRQGEGSEGW